jgi:hypothetical protein
MNYKLHNGNYVPVEGYLGTILSCGLLIYLHGEIALFDAHPVMTLRGLSDTMRVRTVIGTSLLPGLCSEGECETVTHYPLVEPSIVSTNQG